MQTALFLDSYVDGYEEDPALAVTATFERHPAVGPILRVNGPEGEVEFVGWNECNALVEGLTRHLRNFARDVAEAVEAA